MFSFQKKKEAEEEERKKKEKEEEELKAQVSFSILARIVLFVFLWKNRSMQWMRDSTLLDTAL
jgi:hypothetical protein